MKYYAVKKGKTPGIYTSWTECENNVKNVSGALFKSFTSLKDAESFMGMNSSDNTTPVVNVSSETAPLKTYAFVDGSFNQRTNVYGYGGFLIKDGERFVLQGSGNNPEMTSMRNVAGEVEGAMAAVRKAKEIGLTKLDIYYDYQGIESWATGKWKCNKEGTKKYRDFIKDCGIKVIFHKVKGHSGVAGNEEADRLAKNSVGL